MEKTKRDRGRALLLGGGNGMISAIELATQSAIRTGAGLVSPIVQKKLVDILEIKLDNYNTRIFDINYDQEGLEKVISLLDESHGLGYGIGIDINTNQNIKDFTIELFNGATNTVVFDGQITSILSDNIDLLNPKANHIILMNNKEIMNFFKKDNNKLDSTYVQNIADRLKSILVLKGEYTKIYSDKYEEILYTGSTPQMLVAGSGDVLLGIITSLVAQGYTHKEAITTGILLREKAAQFYIEKTGDIISTATDIVENIRFVIKDILKHE